MAAASYAARLLSGMLVRSCIMIRSAMWFLWETK